MLSLTPRTLNKTSAGDRGNTLLLAFHHGYNTQLRGTLHMSHQDEGPFIISIIGEV